MYRRPLLRLVAGALLIFMTGVALSITFWPVDDGFTRDDWLWPLASTPTLGALYIFTRSTLVVDRTHVTISNPLRQVRIPLAHVIDVVPGSNLKIATGYKTFSAWGVEGAKAQVASGSFGSQETLRDLMLTAAASAENSEGPAGYRLTSPGLLFILHLAAVLACSIGLLLGLGANG